MSFADLVDRATGERSPYPYQARLAADGLPDVLRAPTGAGKTMAAVLPWLYRRRHHPVPSVRRDTPRWLVVVLPQRTLVEQTVGVIRGWLARVDPEVGLHVLMGGVDDDDRAWKTEPERDRVFVGTQDMVLSRLLMRGFAEFRSGWPMSFGLLHAGVQFVFDEVQLMGPGLPTSLQLQGLREALGTAIPCHSMWMSATLDPTQLSTVDFSRKPTVVELDDADRQGSLRVRLEATRTVQRAELSSDAKRYSRALAELVLAEHRAATRTLTICNTVDRATAVYDALVTTAPAADVVLLHSRFRPTDRAERTTAATAEPNAAGTIVVSTQVLEAGVDLTSHTLVTELAPWSSLVQRAGRCNRDGRADGARLFWTPPPIGRTASAPYEPDELERSAEVLSRLDRETVTSSDLQAATPDEPAAIHPVLRRRDLLDLFDTAPDLSGNDVDVSRWIRDTTEHTTTVAWRVLADLDEDSPFPGRAELCPAPIGAVSELVGERGASVYDQLVGGWRRAETEDVRPSAVIVLDAARGGYLPDRGFSPASTAAVAPVGIPAAQPEALENDPLTINAGRWVPLAEHLADVERETRRLLDAFGELPGLRPEHRAAATLAGLYHDLGKAHPTFLASLEKANPDRPAEGPGPWAKSPGRAPLRHDPRHFRHELVSALVLADRTTGLLDDVAEPDLVIYLALAHHGKVRLTLRARPGERDGRILGVRDGESTMESILPEGRRIAARALALDAGRLGTGSLTARALVLRDRADLGPFRVAFLEAVVRSADWRASGVGKRT